MALVSCHSGEADKQIVEKSLKASFEKLYYAKYALEFPHNTKRLNNCKTRNNKACLRVFKSFKDAKGNLISLSKSNHSALDSTLNIIGDSCLYKDDNRATSICYGGLMSLYFYHSTEQDNAIFNRVKNYPKSIQGIIFNTEFYWFTNRPNPKQWIDYISSLTINWRFDTQKSFVTKEFNKTIDQFEGEPWVLR